MQRRAGWARPVVLFGGISVFLLWYGAVGWAPNAGSTEPLAVPVASPDPAHDPPRLADLLLPRVRAQAAIVYNPATHEILWESNGHQLRPIASITKVMTMLVFLEQKPDLDAEVVVSQRDVRRASTTYLRRGERITLRNLLHLALMASDNAAARMLARASPWGTVGFVEQMNLKAEELGLRSTSFADPSGLHVSNESTAYDLSRLIAHATTQDNITSDYAQAVLSDTHEPAPADGAEHKPVARRASCRVRRQNRVHRRVRLLSRSGRQDRGQ